MHNIHMKTFVSISCILPVICSFVVAFNGAIAKADSFSVTVDGTDVIFLAGRTDVTVPDPSLPWPGPATHLIRHSFATPEEAQETFPPMVSVTGGDVIRVLDPAIGGINFFNGFGPPLPVFGPSGNTLAGSNLTSLDGISGYIGPQGPLAGVFLDDTIPSTGPAPATLDFTLDGLTQEFVSIAPLLRQIFFIGDGVTTGDVFQEFTAPAGATRLFLGIPDGFGFDGAPGAYDDNDGAYRVLIGVNELPVLPEPNSAMLAVSGLLMLSASVRRRRTLV